MGRKPAKSQKKKTNEIQFYRAWDDLATHINRLNQKRNGQGLTKRSKQQEMVIARKLDNALKYSEYTNADITVIQHPNGFHYDVRNLQ